MGKVARIEKVGKKIRTVIQLYAYEGAAMYDRFTMVKTHVNDTQKTERCSPRRP